MDTRIVDGRVFLVVRNFQFEILVPEIARDWPEHTEYLAEMVKRELNFWKEEHEG